MAEHFFACRVRPGSGLQLPSNGRRQLHVKLRLTHAALSKPNSAARLSIALRGERRWVLCTLGPRCEQSSVGLTIDESDLATLEVDGGGSVDVCGCWVKVGLQANSEEEEEDCLQSEGEESGGESGKEEREKEEERSGKDATTTPLLQPNAKPRRKSRQFFELSPSDAPFAAPTPTRDVGTQGDGGEDEIEERSVAQLLSAGRPPGGRRWHGPPAGGKGKGRGRVRGKGRGKGSKGKGKGMRGWGKDGEGRARNF